MHGDLQIATMLAQKRFGLLQCLSLS